MAKQFFRIRPIGSSAFGPVAKASAPGLDWTVCLQGVDYSNNWKVIDYTLTWFGLKSKRASYDDTQFLDTYPDNLGLHLLSKRAKDLINGKLFPEDNVQWLPVTIRNLSGTEVRPYFALHVPVLQDVINYERSSYIDGKLYVRAIDSNKARRLNVVSPVIETHSHIYLAVSSRIADACKKAGFSIVFSSVLSV